MAHDTALFFYRCCGDGGFVDALLSVEIERGALVEGVPQLHTDGGEHTDRADTEYVSQSVFDSGVFDY